MFNAMFRSIRWILNLLNDFCCRLRWSKPTYLEVNFKELINKIQHPPFLCVFYRGTTGKKCKIYHCIKCMEICLVYNPIHDKGSYLSEAHTLKQPINNSAAFSSLSPALPFPFFWACTSAYMIYTVIRFQTILCLQNHIKSIQPNLKFHS